MDASQLHVLTGIACCIGAGVVLIRLRVYQVMALHVRAVAWEAAPVIAGVIAAGILFHIGPDRHLSRFDVSEPGILTATTLVVVATKIGWIFIERAKKMTR